MTGTSIQAGSLNKAYVAPKGTTKKTQAPDKQLNIFGKIAAGAVALYNNTGTLLEHGNTMTDDQSTALRAKNQQQAETQMKNVSLFTK